MKLVIVESPTKARTIARFLPKGEYTIKASIGHIRDLPAKASDVPARYKGRPESDIGILLDKGVEPIYVIPADKRRTVAELKADLKDADELLIATDEDREGEAIGWHLTQVLSPTVPIRRMVFHEITRSAIQSALRNTRQIKTQLVQAQEARRMLDRFVGWRLSPVLWRKIAPKLSAGRVQSVALRLLVEREKKRLAFVGAGYWDIRARLSVPEGPAPPAFDAIMTALGDRRIATGRDFDDDTGELKASVQKEVLLLGKAQAADLKEALLAATWKVESVESKERKKYPAPPFITSTLQQEASRKFRWGAKKTMGVAQKLYQEGYITYMRTDSVQLSQEALMASRQVIERMYGADYLSRNVRQYKSKSAGAQEAHEAIRPAGTEMKPVRALGLTGDEARLYDLIWKRTVACQMASALLRHTTARIAAVMRQQETAHFRASGREVLFDGFLKVYVEGRDDPEKDSTRAPLPMLIADQRLNCLGVEPKEHATQPPARYTEASLIKKLEQEGVGRPSTYASIMDKITRKREKKELVVRQGRALAPTFTAFAVNQLMEANFERLVDYGFTADMEKVLDDIAAGHRNHTEFLLDFYQGNTGLREDVDKAMENVDPRTISTITAPKWGQCVVRIGRFGPYAEAEMNGIVYRGSIPAALLPADATEESLMALLRLKKEARVLGTHPETERNIVLKNGPYGWYVEHVNPEGGRGRPPRASLLDGMLAEDMDLDLALQLLSFPKELGAHPESGEPVTAHLGRHGPYVRHKSVNATLPKGIDVLMVTLEPALDVLAKKGARPGVVRTLGEAPDGKSVELLEGRYGPYVKHGRTNASIPKNLDATAVSLEQALQLLEAKKARKKPKRRTKRR